MDKINLFIYNHNYMQSMLPVLRDAPFSLLAGGLHHCDPSWNKPADGIDQCYKLYVPIRGRARLGLAGQDALLRPGYAYLIPGYHLARQECDRRMDVFWVHFVPQSLYLAFLLSHVTSVQSWRRASVEHWRTAWGEIPSLFQGDSLSVFYRVQAMLLDFVSRSLKRCGIDRAAPVAPVFEQLKPAVAFMDRQLLDNPKLAAIAETVHLAPNYFHRRFTAAFRVTPFGYMLGRRLNLGRQLLWSTNLTLDRIAARSGFSSAFHFSKLFKKHCGLSPSEFRRRAVS